MQTREDQTLVVAEVFGPTFQGEGPSLGQRATFIRLGTCNLHCTWCDTPYTWDWKLYNPKDELHRMTVASLIESVEGRKFSAYDKPLVVITGGEPLLQRQKLAPFMTHAMNEHWRIEIETNGTQMPFPWFTFPHYNVSPKLRHSGNTPEEAIVPEAMLELARRSSTFKFVLESTDDYLEVEDICAQFEIPPWDVYIMPQGTEESVLSKRSVALAEGALERGYNLTTRLHIMIWGNVRAR